MLWASEALGRDGKPAVLLLAATRTKASLTAEVGYVADTLPEGPLAGRYWRGEGASPVAVTVLWPGGWPKPGPLNKIHPRKDTPQAAVTEVNGGRRLHLKLEEEDLSYEQDQE